MNYIELINAFWDKRAVYPLSSSEADFYFYLLKVCDSRKWTNPFKLPTQIIERDMYLNRRSICEIRNKLQQSGYIRFTASTKRGEVTEYEIVDICEDPFENVNRTQTERKPNANRTQSVTQTASPTPPIEEEKEKEKSPNGDKKKVEPSFFEADETGKRYDGFILDYVSDGFYQIFTEWLEYKKKRRERYKDDVQVKKCYKRLYELSEGRVDYATAIIDSSIANSYQGFFALKPYEKEQINRKMQQNGTAVQFTQRSGNAAPKRGVDDFDEEDD